MNSESNIAKPKVSIGIACYNRPETLRRTLESVVNQTYSNLEIVVSDNASPNPDVEKIAREFAAKDHRIKYYRQSENRGMGFNGNFVLANSTGEYFMWLCDDDWISHNYVEECIAKINSHNGLSLVTGKIDTYKTMNITNNSPYVRILRYFLNYGYVHSMVFCIMPRAEIKIPYLSLHGADWIIVADVLFKGKLIVAEKATIFYSLNGTSSETVDYARAQGLNRLSKRRPLFSIAFAYMRHVFRGDPPYENLSLLVRIIFPVLVLTAMILARLKANTLHILKILLPQPIVDFLNKISDRKRNNIVPSK